MKPFNHRDTEYTKITLRISVKFRVLRVPVVNFVFRTSVIGGGENRDA